MTNGGDDLSTNTATNAPPIPARGRRPRRRGKGITLKTRQAVAGWAFVAPVVVLLGVFLVFPIIMALWVSVSDWSGAGSPFTGDFVGLSNFTDILVDGGLATRQFGTSLRNNLWYVIVSVPIITALALGLARIVSKPRKGVGLLRTAYYFPSVTSTVAAVIIFQFLFNVSGAINHMLAWVNISGPNWTTDPRGVLHLALGAIGVEQAPGWATENAVLGLPLWEWLSGPSVAMMVFIFMASLGASGTFMLIFLAGLKQISPDVYEAAAIDGAGRWTQFVKITLPLLRPTMLTVLTLSLIGSWQVFDQIFAAGEAGGPANTTLTPAFLSFSWSFNNQQWGRGAATAFLLFCIIVVFSLIQRHVLRESSTVPRRKRFYK